MGEVWRVFQLILSTQRPQRRRATVLNDKLRAVPDNSGEMPAGIKDNFASSPTHGRAGPWHPAASGFPVRVKMLLHGILQRTNTPLQKEGTVRMQHREVGFTARKHAPSAQTPASSNTASSSTCAPRATCSFVEYSFELCVIPATLGTNSIALGTSGAISTESCPAAAIISRVDN